MAALAFLDEQLAQPIRVPFMSLSLPVVLKILEIANLKEDDLICDLGCGDGRFLIEASKRYKTRGIGVDIDKKAVEMSRYNVNAEKLNDKIQITEGDFTQFDTSIADVVFLWLTDFSTLRIRPQLVQQMKYGSKIVTIDKLGRWKATETHQFSYVLEFDHRVVTHTIYVHKIDLNDEQRKDLANIYPEEYGMEEPPIAPPPPPL